MHDDVPYPIAKCHQCGGDVYLCEQPNGTCRLKMLAREWLYAWNMDAYVDDRALLNEDAKKLAPVLRKVEDGAWDRRVAELEAAGRPCGAAWTSPLRGEEPVPPTCQRAHGHDGPHRSSHGSGSGSWEWTTRGEAVKIVPKKCPQAYDPRKLRDLLDAAVENHCREDSPPCAGGEGEEAMPIEDWCGVCLLAHDIEAMCLAGQRLEGE